MNELLGWLLLALGVGAAVAWRLAARKRRDAAPPLPPPSDETAPEQADAAAEAQSLAEAQAELQRVADAAAAQREAADRAARQRAVEAEAAAEAEAEAGAERERQAAAAATAAEAARRQAERLQAERIEAEQAAMRRAEARAAEQAELHRMAAEAEAETAANAERERQAAERAQAEAQRLCAQRAESERLAVAQAAVAVPKSAAQTLVLVADDSKVVRIKTGRLLASHQYRVCYAADGLEAVQVLQAQSPDIVITDVEMPGLDGFELTRRIRADARTAHIPVIMITAADDRHRGQADSAGVSVLLGKPYPEDVLIAHIAEAMRAPVPA